MKKVLFVMVVFLLSAALSGCWFIIVPIPNYAGGGGHPAITPDHSADITNCNPPRYGLKKGMTRDEVLKQLGEPTSKEEHGAIIFWYYQKTLKVNFQRYDKEGDYYLTNWTDIKTR